MHRIDSATARANANGEGKTGFSDNGDLPNQDATYFTPEWSNALQEEVAGVIEGLGLTLDKSDNGQLLATLVHQFGEKKVLNDAIAEYKDMIKDDRKRLDKLERQTYADTQVGEVFWTAKHFATASEVATYKGYGTWERALQGRVAVGFSDAPDDYVDFRTHGKEYGEREHTLTLNEMPSHRHSTDPFNKFASNASESGKSTKGLGDYDEAETEYGDGDMSNADWVKATEAIKGGGLAHNNMQPSKTLDCWKRVS